MTDAQIQQFNNFMYGLRFYCLMPYVGTDPKLKDTWLEVSCTPDIEQALDRSCGFSRTRNVFRHGPHNIAVWRENQSPCSLHVTLNRDGERYWIQLDYDYWRPFWDVVSWVGHAVECFRNDVIKIARTDPFRVRNYLNARGYGIPLVTKET